VANLTPSPARVTTRRPETKFLRTGLSNSSNFMPSPRESFNSVSKDAPFCWFSTFDRVDTPTPVILLSLSSVQPFSRRNWARRSPSCCGLVSMLCLDPGRFVYPHIMVANQDGFQ
jgi:hypothetical protein